MKALQNEFGSSKKQTAGGSGLDRSSRAGSVSSISRGGGGGGAGEEALNVVRAAGDGVDIAGFARRFFNETAGFDFVNELIINDDETPATLCGLLLSSSLPHASCRR